MNDCRAENHHATLHVGDLGRMAYAEAVALQRRLQREIIESRSAGGGPPRAVGHLLLVEHDPPVITITRRREARGHLVASTAELREAGVDLAQTDRGGDITYHGPGQLVVYPILDLNCLDLRLGSYMRWLEQIVIDVLSTFGIDGVRDPAAPGVWVPADADHRQVHPAGPSQHDAATMQPRARPSIEQQDAATKICAMGVRISRWVSMHGLALNVTTNLEHFDLIVPCGLAGRGVTSMQRELGERCPPMSEVKGRIVERFQSEIERRREA